MRPPWFYGPFQPERQTQWFRAVRRGRFPLVGDGTQRRSMVFTGNLVDGLLRAEVAAAAPGRAWWIADPRALRRSRDILSTVREALAAEGLRRQRRPAPTARGSSAPSPSAADGVLQARGRYLQAVHVLGELKDTIACDIRAVDATSSATGPGRRHVLLDGHARPASAGASSGGHRRRS